MAGGLVIGVVTELSTVWIPLELKFVWALAALVAIPIGLAAGVGLALLLGLPTLCLRSDYFAITTIATAEILRFLIRSRSSTALTGGPFGLQGAADAFRRVNPLPARWDVSWRNFNFSNADVWLLLVAWVLVVACTLLVARPALNEPSSSGGART
jgi:branched-chain amino acid transport system permease protein